MFNAILVICTGNICRSPTGERLLRRAFPHIRVRSAGIQAVKNASADNMASMIAERDGLSLANHISTQVTVEMAHQYPLILAMEQHHIEFISRKSPQLRGKIMLFGHWLEEKEIPDPYGQGEEAFTFVYQMLKTACESWKGKLI
ncbi:protein tyrosine phosphatase [Pantoea ananatis]|uniref:arsenate reductase/protein-tyrosine-phosphatase family protein n=1 Tax=Pantoea ananas TaxID=553 RepID=UPI000E255142|nr:protein tyrosine phosphatase [Pantoea ananatis]REE79668.1 protein-tyrosine phosphatase [Pantoea ananatis]